MVHQYGKDIYKFTRGDSWSIICIAHDSGIVTVEKLTHPIDAKEDLVRRFCIEAEEAITIYEIEQHNKRFNGGV